MLLALAGTLLAAALALLGLALARLDAGPPPDELDASLDGRWEEVDADRAPRDRAPTP
jgi:hypothetical protein